MATTKLYLDTRAVRNGCAAPVKLSITHHGETSLLGLNISLLPSQWDKKQSKVIGHPNKRMIEGFLTRRKLDADAIIIRLMETGEIGKMRAKDIRDRIACGFSPEDKGAGKDCLFAERFRKSMMEKRRENTRLIYGQTLRRMLAYDASLEGLSFEDITREWLLGFDDFMARTSPSRNARNIHLRNIRAVFNEAIDDEVTTAYPFRRFKIKPEATAKRSLTVEQLRAFFSAELEPHLEKYMDMFKLTFCLIGINTIDLCHLSEVKDGRVEYHRAKTGRLYSIKVEPEAMELIDKHRGKAYLLDPLDHYGDYRVYARRLNAMLKRVGCCSLTRNGKKAYKPMFPGITTYWARHTWATIAASLDIPKETIAAALGHGGNTVTDIYIDFDQRKVDEANRRVLDWVFKGDPR